MSFMHRFLILAKNSIHSYSGKIRVYLLLRQFSQHFLSLEAEGGHKLVAETNSLNDNIILALPALISFLAYEPNLELKLMPHVEQNHDVRKFII